MNDGTLPPRLQSRKPIWWPNPDALGFDAAMARSSLSGDMVKEAELAWERFGPLLARLFPETAADGGRNRSDLRELHSIAGMIGLKRGRLLAKCDYALQTTGSIKARGGVFEVLTHAVDIGGKAGLVEKGGELSKLASPEAKEFFSRHRLLVGSTGNLGYSVGLAGCRLGFKVEVHMSHDAKQWKKERLTALGAHVVEHGSDFSQAVRAAREAAARQPNSHFVDDERSLTLFMGYAAAARELADQLEHSGIVVDLEHPLHVYLPCGVGGAPGGVTFGLKHIFGDAVRCIFVEPVGSPCMLVQLALGADRPVSVYDCGLDNRTIADGLAVAQASQLVARETRHLIEGIVTVEDESLLIWLAHMWRLEKMRLEPSAASGFAALVEFGGEIEAPNSSKEITRVVWTTGGAYQPETEFATALEWGNKLISSM
ncbi:D-serine ammonia-lyase [uncultured Nitratireductor sp.]|mgnify:CR=1 FL=1|uniref:D-serine ammonia-lyase n=1 Tax=uncultured Nitratireductor sp. TaxID=520953 RepID=UPI0025D186E0|nr:D-serine ammonia-lyase [uncultured Nitratireductor sp.]